MKAKKGKIFLLILLIGIFLVGTGYLGISRLYNQRFAYGTWINGIYCTGKTVAEVNEMLAEQTEIEDFRMTDMYGDTSVIKGHEIGLKIDYNGQLSKIIESQNPYLWFDNLQQNFQEISVKPEYVFSEILLSKAIEKTDIVVAANLKIQDIEIRRGQNGYELYNGTTDILEKQKVIKCVCEAIYRGEFAINLAESGCYTDLVLTEEMQKKIELYDKIKEFQDVGITYDMGDAMVEIGPDIVADWILVDENGQFILDESGGLVLRKEGIDEFIKELASQYDTYGGTRIFQTTSGNSIEISGGIYGNKLDQKAEVLYLTDAFLNDIRENHIPAYEKEAFVRGKNDIGDTYIEIDMTNQKMYYYENGELILETDVVTGSVEEGHKTPVGVNYIYYKSRNTILKGKDYESFVKYWMAVKGGIGIHDASWRKKFGGEIYIKNGSHGCINTPGDVMKELYNAAKLGTPVVMFY